MLVSMTGHSSDNAPQTHQPPHRRRTGIERGGASERWPTLSLIGNLQERLCSNGQWKLSRRWRGVKKEREGDHASVRRRGGVGRRSVSDYFPNGKNPSPVRIRRPHKVTDLQKPHGVKIS